MYLFLLLPLIPGLLAFMLTPLSTIQQYLAFYDICFGGYLLSIVMSLFLHWGECHYRKILKEAVLYQILMNFCMIWRLVFMTLGVLLLMTSTLISVLNIPVPIWQTVVATVYGLTLMVTGIRFIVKLCNFEHALREDLGWK